jgi:hypothetical protein
VRPIGRQACKKWKHAWPVNMYHGEHDDAMMMMMMMMMIPYWPKIHPAVHGMFLYVVTRQNSPGG